MDLIKIGNGKLSGMDYDGKVDEIKYLTACGIKNAYVMLSEKEQCGLFGKVQQRKNSGKSK